MLPLRGSICMGVDYRNHRFATGLPPGWSPGSGRLFACNRHACIHAKMIQQTRHLNPERVGLECCILSHGSSRLHRPMHPYLTHYTPHTIHPTPYTRHPTPYTLHPTPNAFACTCQYFWSSHASQILLRNSVWSGESSHASRK